MKLSHSNNPDHFAACYLYILERMRARRQQTEQKRDRHPAHRQPLPPSAPRPGGAQMDRHGPQQPGMGGM